MCVKFCISANSIETLSYFRLYVLPVSLSSLATDSGRIFNNNSSDFLFAFLVSFA